MLIEACIGLNQCMDVLANLPTGCAKIVILRSKYAPTNSWHVLNDEQYKSASHEFIR